MAYTFLSEFFSTKKTSPYAPRPNVYLIVKSYAVKLTDDFFLFKSGVFIGEDLVGDSYPCI